jgi:hypothetical protein
MNSSIRVSAGLPRRCRGRRVAARLRHGPLPDDLLGARRLYSRPSPTSSVAARFAPDATRSVPHRPVSFSARVRNPRLMHRWHFGDPMSGPANAAIGVDVQHVFSAPGVYQVTHAVLDGGAVISWHSRDVLVSLQP